jgi:hypothetical protein
MKDWLGKDYTVGDTVIYGASSGRAIVMVLGTVTRIWNVFRNHDTYEWEVLPPGQLPPFQRKWNHALRNYMDLPEREETHTRVQVQPIRSTRWKQHYGNKPVTLIVTENITKWEGEVPDDI